jgi:hypothetical protein
VSGEQRWEECFLHSTARHAGSLLVYILMMNVSIL